MSCWEEVAVWYERGCVPGEAFVPGAGLCARRGAVCWEPDCVPGGGPCAGSGAVCRECAVCREGGRVPGGLAMGGAWTSFPGIWFWWLFQFSLGIAWKL